MVVRIGLVADAQHADCEDSKSFRGNPRYYRRALNSLQRAAAEFRDCSAVINLGDLVDAKARGQPECFDNALRALDLSNVPIYHSYGNHELEVIESREELGKKLKMPFRQHRNGDLVGYFTKDLSARIRLIVLDTYDICIQRPSDSELYRKAMEVLNKRNPNSNKKSPEGLLGVDRRYVSMGGAMSSQQLSWLIDTLDQARGKGQRVIIASHQPLLPDSVSFANLPASLAWNFEEIGNLLENYSDIVALCLSGHAHRDGYGRSPRGIHYRVLEAMLEHREATFAIMEVDDQQIKIRGYGACPSAVYLMDHCKVNVLSNL